jgi:hypothetical protein
MDTMPLVPGVPSDKGVAMNVPPASLLDAMTKEVKDAVATLPDGARGALVGVATTKGVNLAVVSKLNGHVDVTAWIGKSWSEPIAGGSAVQIHW